MVKQCQLYSTWLIIFIIIYSHIITYSHIYSHVVLIMVVIKIMTMTKIQIWLYDYTWTVVASYPSHENHVFVEYIVGIFYFAQIFLASNGVILLFDLDDLKVLQEVKSYLESYGFQIRMKWVVVNSLPLMSNENPSFKVPFQSIKLTFYFSSFQL